MSRANRRTTSNGRSIGWAGRRRTVAAVLWIAIHTAANTPPAAAQVDNGYIGIYADAAGTQPCATVVQDTTLFVIAKVAGISAPGLTGAEFRIEVENPAGWDLTYNAPAADGFVGDPIDTHPQDPAAGAGVQITFAACRPPFHGQVGLGTISVFKMPPAAPTHLFVKSHRLPSGSVDDCPRLSVCDQPYYPKVCMTTAGESCGLQEVTTTDNPVFVAGLNIDEEAPTQAMTGSQLVEALRSERRLAVNFAPAKDERAVPMALSGSVSDIIQQLVADGQYRERVINGRLVIYPVAAAFDSVVHLPAGRFENVHRFAAARDYARWIRAKVPGFENFLEPVTVTTGSPPYSNDEVISLSAEASVIEHFVQLLASNPHRVFTIRPAPSGLPMLDFRIIP